MSSPHITNFVSQQVEETIVIDGMRLLKVWYMVADWSDGKRRELRHCFSDQEFETGKYLDIDLWTPLEETADE